MTAEWIIDLGPEGGIGGGEVVATGTPESLIGHPISRTGKCLNELIETANRPAAVGDTRRKNH